MKVQAEAKDHILSRASTSTTTYVLKRPLDVCLALFFLLVLSPLLACVSLMVVVLMGWPVFFRQWRVGLHGMRFRVWKFRTMTCDRDARGELLPDTERLRPCGRLLRRASVDELPQLANVLFGQMSLVGPRALPVEHLEKMPRKYARRFDVTPGMTGWTQVIYRGRNRTWDEKYLLDLQYVESQSLWMDVRIMLMTIGAVIRRFKFNKRGESLNTEGFHE